MAIFSTYSMRDYKIMPTIVKTHKVFDDLPPIVNYHYKNVIVFKMLSEKQITSVKKKYVKKQLILKQITNFIPLVSISMFSKNINLFIILAVIELLLGANDINIMVIILSFILLNSCSNYNNNIFHIYLLFTFLYLCVQYAFMRDINLSHLLIIGTTASIIMFSFYFYYHQDSIIVPIIFTFFSTLFMPFAIARDNKIINDNLLDNTYEVYKTLV